MQCERPVVGEQVERPPAGRGVRRHERAVLALVEEGAGLLPRPGRGEVTNVVFRDLHRLGNRAERRDDLEGQPLVPPNARVVAEQEALRRERAPDPGHHIVSHPLETGREQLGDYVRSVAIHDKRGQPVPLGVHRAPGGGWNRGAPGGRRPDPAAPPRRVHGLPPAGEQA